MRVNTMKAKVLRGEMVFGLAMDSADPIMVEYAAMAGLDFVRIDCEHGPATLGDLEHLARAAEAADVTPTARLAANRPDVVTQVLNRGFAGLTFPHIATAEDAAAAVRSAKFAPDGDRAITSPAGRGMHARWSLGVPAEDAFAFANRETLVTCLIEDPAGVENVEAIAAVPGVDLITFGAGDLSATAGHIGDFNHPDVRALIRDGIRRARAAGKPVGISVGSKSMERAEEFIAAGVTVVQLLPAPLLVDAVARMRDALTG
ncbi:HpcH/HpaI aldolase family protein [Jiangella aurantiaca]|nr:aldolase/citrate lyase family protein [Jiangella aurantiaca]